MYTGTIFNWYDNSGFTVDQPVVDTTNRPLFMVVNAFDKGPEKLMEVDANNFNQLFGTMSYDKYGQGSIQAQRIIDAGGRLLVKRVCANDATLAYSVLVAHLTASTRTIRWTIEKLNLNVNESIKKFSEIKEKAITKFQTSDVNINNYLDTGEMSGDEITLPVFIIADNGRGLSNKAVRIIPDYDTSKGVGRMLYRFSIYEGTTLVENVNISLDPSFTYNGDYYGLDKTRTTQIIGEVISQEYDYFVKIVEKFIFATEGKMPITEEDHKITRNYIVNNVDLVFAKTIAGIEDGGGGVQGAEYDPETHEIAKTEANGGYYYETAGNPNPLPVGDLLDQAYGNLFADQGDNGLYGNTPAKFGNETDVMKMQNISFSGQCIPSDKSDENRYKRYILDIASVYLGYDTDGKPIDEVWDMDSHKIFAVADANYHKLIKDCIANFVEYRKDCIFLRDHGIGAYNLSDVQDITNQYILVNNIYDLRNYDFNGGNDEVYTIRNLRSKFIADYGTTYEAIDPVSRRNVEVTMLYDVVVKLTNMYIEKGPFSPLAGTYNGFQLDSAIPGTINFTPIITPSTNQKQAIDDLRLNYAIFEDEDTCVVQSSYTSQDANTQLSYINNVLAIQEVARVVRTVCPRNRFRLITGSDMSEYANAVSRVLQSYNSYFEVLEFQYTEDKLRAVQKIFYASINFSFNNWAQTEIFDLYALSNTTQTSINS